MTGPAVELKTKLKNRLGSLAEFVIVSVLSEGSEGLLKNEGFIDMGCPHRGHGCHVQG